MLSTNIRRINNDQDKDRDNDIKNENFLFRPGLGTHPDSEWNLISLSPKSIDRLSGGVKKSREPFAKDIPPDKLYPLPGLQAATERLQYAASLAAVAIITGEVGAGKSTTLRYTASKLHPSLYRVIPVVAAIEKAPLASADHVRKSSSELIGSPMPAALHRSASDRSRLRGQDNLQHSVKIQ